jgi:hypothetical protein
MIRHKFEKRLLMREVNERIRDFNTRFQVVTGTYDLLCECPGSDCFQRLEVPTSIYEELRTYEDRFLVGTGHEQPEQERVVAQNGTHLVVAASSPPVDQAAQQQASVP